MTSVAIVEALRTPFGKLGGKLQWYSAVDLDSVAAKAAGDLGATSPVRSTCPGFAIQTALEKVGLSVRDLKRNMCWLRPGRCHHHRSLNR